MFGVKPNSGVPLPRPAPQPPKQESLDWISMIALSAILGLASFVFLPLEAALSMFLAVASFCVLGKCNSDSPQGSAPPPRYTWYPNRFPYSEGKSARERFVPRPSPFVFPARGRTWRMGPQQRERVG